MPGFLLRLAASALGLWGASVIVPGVDIDGFGTLFWAALLLGFVNAIVRPVILIMTLPLTFLTLGLFLLVINAMMLGLVAWFLSGFHVAGFFSAVFGSIVVSIVSGIASQMFGSDAKVERLVVVEEQRRLG